MSCIVNPKYRWLNSLLVATYLIATLSQLIQTINSERKAVHLFLSVACGFLAFSVSRQKPWAYIAIGLMNIVGMFGLLNDTTSLSDFGFLMLIFCGASAWCAFFLRGQLLMPVRNEEGSSADID